MRIYKLEYHGIHIDLESITAITEPDASLAGFKVYLKLHDHPLYLNYAMRERSIGYATNTGSLLEQHLKDHADLMATWKHYAEETGPLR